MGDYLWLVVGFCWFQQVLLDNLLVLVLFDFECLCKSCEYGMLLLVYDLLVCEGVWLFWLDVLFVGYLVLVNVVVGVVFE